MEARPKIKLTLSPLDKKLELIGKTFLVVMWSLTLYTFFKMPTTIPTHFNSSGKADDYGNKLIILFLPIIGSVIYFALTKLNNYPHIFNYVTKITEDNAQKQYTIATRSLRVMKLAILIIFSLIILFTYLTAIGVTNGLGSSFSLLLEGFYLLSIVIVVIKSIKENNKSA
jgi:uncharacterized membrane protein